ncbi:MAG: hypothetical protein EZS28_017077, partial [Streblomastix strix]
MAHLYRSAEHKPISIKVVGKVDYTPIVPCAEDVNVSDSIFTSKSENHSVILFEPSVKS